MKSIKHVTDMGTIRWISLDGELHRENGPAIVWMSRHNEWYLYGKRHRENGPAFIGSSHKAWYKHGVRHRLDGPAIERGDGSKVWFIDGTQYTEKEFNHETVKRNIDRLTL